MSDHPFDADVFRIDWRRGPFLALFALQGLVVVASVFVAGLDGLVVVSIPIAFGAAIAWVIGTLSIGPVGFTLYRVNRAKWNDITRVDQVSVLGLPYLRVERNTGLPWWMPLYVSGPRPLVQSLADWVPRTSAIAETLDTMLKAAEQECRDAS